MPAFAPVLSESDGCVVADTDGCAIVLLGRDCTVGWEAKALAGIVVIVELGEIKVMKAASDVLATSVTLVTGEYGPLFEF